jgi:type IV pilus assembly protein PilF
MNVWRVAACMGVLLAAVYNLSACSSVAPQLDTLTQAEPDSTRQRAMRRLSLASAYFEQKQNDVAQQEVRAALKIDPTYADAYSLLGLIHQRENAPVLAQQSFLQAIVLAARSPLRTDDLAAIQHNYGWFLCEQNDFTQAKLQFDLALAQPSYRQADKTRQALRLCQERAGLKADARKSNN